MAGAERPSRVAPRGQMAGRDARMATLGAGRQVCHPERRVRRDDGSATASAFATVRTLVRAACQRRFNAAACRGGRTREAGIAS